MKMSKSVLLPIADGTEEIEAVCIIDTLRRAKADVTVASVTGKFLVTCSRGVKITADVHIADCINKDYDLVVLPGGMPGAEHLRDSAQLTAILKKQKERGGYYGAICASPAVVLEHHGLVGTAKATCYPSFAEKLQNAQPGVKVVADGQLITSQGPATAIAFSLKLVEVLFGQDVAQQVGKGMLV